MNIDPTGMAIKDWCQQMVPMLQQYGQVPFLQDDQDWQPWGQHLCKLPGIAGFNPPDPLQFDDFYEWAKRFNSTVPL